MTTSVLNRFLVNDDVFIHYLNMDNNNTYLENEEKALFEVTHDCIVYDIRDENKTKFEHPCLGMFYTKKGDDYTLSWYFKPDKSFKEGTSIPVKHFSNLIAAEKYVFEYIMRNILYHDPNKSLV